MKLEKMKELYNDIKYFENTDYISVPVFLKKTIDREWKRIYWYERLFINIGRIMRGVGAYPYNK